MFAHRKCVCVCERNKYQQNQPTPNKKKNIPWWKIQQICFFSSLLLLIKKICWECTVLAVIHLDERTCMSIYKIYTNVSVCLCLCLCRHVCVLYIYITFTYSSFIIVIMIISHFFLTFFFFLSFFLLRCMHVCVCVRAEYTVCLSVCFGYVAIAPLAFLTYIYIFSSSSSATSCIVILQFFFHSTKKSNTFFFLSLSLCGSSSPFLPFLIVLSDVSQFICFHFFPNEH